MLARYRATERPEVRLGNVNSVTLAATLSHCPVPNQIALEKLVSQ